MESKIFNSGALRAAASHLTRTAINAALPPHSLMTGKPLNVRALDEALLWQALTFLDAPCCEACGFPFEFDQGKGALCGRCTAKRPAYHRARAAITYSDASRKLVLDFKYGGRTDGMPFFTAQMRRAGRAMLQDADLLIPVPLHRARLRERRFNQAALLARALSKSCALPYDTNALMRLKNTPSQGTQSWRARRRNVAAAFGVSETAKQRIRDKKIVLIDDVQTTGATLEACARTLRRAGAAQIDALCLMRVVRGEQIPT